jgi:hypothetical protein
MPAAKDRIFIAIGVSRPLGGLDELPGAITAAERMAAWADSQGYLTRRLHDGIYPEITVDLLRKEITAAVEDVTTHSTLQRLVVFFAGHGAALAVGDQYWILTHWKRDPSEAIKVSSLQRMLEYYGPRQVALIGDACQEFSARFLDLVGSAVLRMPEEEQRPYELDQFFAVDVGKQAFMIKANSDQTDFCLFTEVLLDALESDGAAASFEQVGSDRVVTSQSLARYLDANVAKEAGKYGVRMVPRPRPGFYTDRVYLTLPQAPADAGPKFGWSVPAGGEDSHSYGVPMEEGVVHRGVEPEPRIVRKVANVAPATRRALQQRGHALNAEREASRKAFVDQVGSAAGRDHFETACGICVSGADVVQVDVAFGSASRVAEQPNWFRVAPQPAGVAHLAWSDALVTLADGRIVAVCAVLGFVADLHLMDAGAVSLFHRPLGEPHHDGQQTVDLLARMQAGLLDRQAIVDAAATLRNSKHRILTLGCIAAQFYDAIRDVDSLRSMAAFYVMHNQPVPLDIVLYGGGRIRQYEGRLYADIPAVPPRQPRTEQEGRQGFTTQATPAHMGHPVAGRIPWMRQAWGAVATAQCDPSSEVWRQLALQVLPHLAPGTFTTAQPDGRATLSSLALLSSL